MGHNHLDSALRGTDFAQRSGQHKRVYTLSWLGVPYKVSQRVPHCVVV